MKAKRNHVVFDVYRNGRKLCRAGVGGSGVLTAIIDWVGKEGKVGRRRPDRANFTVGGLRYNANGNDVHPRWVSLHLLPGDVIRVKIGKSKSFDKPAKEEVFTVEDARRSQENYLNHVAPQFGWVKPAKAPRARNRRA